MITMILMSLNCASNHRQLHQNVPRKKTGKSTRQFTYVRFYPPPPKKTLWIIVRHYTYCIVFYIKFEISEMLDGQRQQCTPHNRPLTFNVGKWFLFYADLVYAVLFTNVSTAQIENMCTPFTAEPSSSRVPSHTPLQ